MRYFKSISNGYIISIGTGSGGAEIAEQEYTEILEAVRNRPAPPKGYDYILSETLDWMLIEAPEPDQIEDPAEIEDYENALIEMGVDLNGD